jgi:hypothetical protein
MVEAKLCGRLVKDWQLRVETAKSIEKKWKASFGSPRCAPALILIASEVDLLALLRPLFPRHLLSCSCSCSQPRS